MVNVLFSGRNTYQYTPYCYNASQFDCQSKHIFFLFIMCRHNRHNMAHGFLNLHFLLVIFACLSVLKCFNKCIRMVLLLCIDSDTFRLITTFISEKMREKKKFFVFIDMLIVCPKLFQLLCTIIFFFSISISIRTVAFMELILVC